MELLEVSGEGDALLAEQLVSAGASVDDTGDEGQTALDRVARDGNLEVVRFLVEHGSAVDTKDNDGSTPLMLAAVDGHLAVVRYLVEHAACIDASDNDGWSPLTWAARYGQFDVVRYLVEHEAAVDKLDNDGWTPLMRAAICGHFDVVRFLVVHGAIVEAGCRLGVTPLMRAASGGHLDVMCILLEHGAGVDASDNDGWTPLIWSACYGHWDAVRFIVEHGANVDATMSSGWTLLMWAASRGYLDLMRFLVEHGAAVDVRDKNGRTPLIEAANGCSFDMARYLVEYGVSVNACDNVGKTPLMRVARVGQLDMARFFVEHGADVNASDWDGRTPLIRAAESGHLDVVQFLVECGAAVDVRDRNGSMPLILAAGGGHLDVVRYLVENGAVLYVASRFGETPLMSAASGGHLDVVQFFVERGAIVDASNKDGKTPLLKAASGGHMDVVQFLLDLRGNVNDRESGYRSTLVEAADNGHLNVVRFLVERGAAVDAHDNNDWTPLIWAACYSRSLVHWDVARFLVEHGAAVNACDDDGWTPLMWAVSGGKLNIVRYLVEHGAAKDANDSKGVTPLMEAAENDRLDVVQFLVERGAAMDASDSRGVTPLMVAAEFGYLGVVEFLTEHIPVRGGLDTNGQTQVRDTIKYDHLDVEQYLVEPNAAVNDPDSGDQTQIMEVVRNDHPLFHLEMTPFLVENEVDPNARDRDRETPLMKAAKNGHLDVVRCLVQHGVELDGYDCEGHTPLTRAVEFGHLAVVRFLVNHGANPNLMSKSGDTALGIASKIGHQKIVQFLLQHVRYNDWRTQTTIADEIVTRHTNIPSSWLIPPFELEVEPFLDDEHIGGDYRGKWLEADVVVKLFVDGATNATFAEEVCLWHQLRHPNVLKLYGVCNAEHHLFVCEYASNGSLPQYLKSCDGDLQTPWKFLHEAALGLEYLHERKIVHGNLRGSNILIGSDGLAKLSGFTLSKSSSEGRQYQFGDWVRWAAPESLESESVSFASDVYSLGMCIIEAASGKYPYSMESKIFVESAKKRYNDLTIYRICNGALSTDEQRQLVLAMCRNNPRERLQIPAVVDKLEQFAEMEAAIFNQYAKPESLVTFDEIDHGKTYSLWSKVQTLVGQSANALYQQMYHELELIYDTLKSKSHPQSTIQRFNDLLMECQKSLDALPQQSLVRRLSQTRARDFSIQGLHRRISLLLQLVYPQEHDTDARGTEWNRLCREQVEVFVSEASEACVLLSSVDSEEDRSTLIAVLRAELRNSDGKYTDKQHAVLQKTYDNIVSKSLKDVHLATTPEWFIPWFELEMNEMKTLGVGGFGSVIKAKWLDSEVVVKKLEISPKDAANVDMKREMRQMFEREVGIWFGLSHPHVVRLFGACHVGRPFFVCELAPNGTLVEYLSDHPDELWTKFREAALGVQYLHARGIVHGDLKGNNIMIGSDGKSKVTDFGLSGVFGDDSTEMVVSGAWHWVAPECILGQKPTFASDIYSLGMCIIEALRVTNGDEDDLPWGALPNAAVKFHATRRHLLPQRPKNSSDEAWTLIERMCKSDPADRVLIMTVVDELEKLAGLHRDLSVEIDDMFGDNGEVRRLPLSVAGEFTEMKSWIDKCDAMHGWEGSVLKNIYRLLWDRLDQVATQLLPDGEDIVVVEATTNYLNVLIEHSKQRTREALGITGVIPLIKFTELALGGYALHRRLDKFMAAHVVSNEPSSLHDWTSACSTFMELSSSPAPVYSDDDCSANEVTGDVTSTASSTEVVAAT